MGWVDRLGAKKTGRVEVESRERVDTDYHGVWSLWSTDGMETFFVGSGVEDWSGRERVVTYEGYVGSVKCLQWGHDP